uniref:Uncharacterized protein n=1 Tax=Arundo donax TaxID=35708 RepID=A0A0A8ZNS5_ARUDO
MELRLGRAGNLREAARGIGIQEEQFRRKETALPLCSVQSFSNRLVLLL